MWPLTPSPTGFSAPVMRSPGRTRLPPTAPSRIVRLVERKSGAHSECGTPDAAPSSPHLLRHYSTVACQSPLSARLLRYTFVSVIHTALRTVPGYTLYKTRSRCNAHPLRCIVILMSILSFFALYAAQIVFSLPLNSPLLESYDYIGN